MMRIALMGMVLIVAAPAIAAQDRGVTLHEGSSGKVTALRRHQAAFVTLDANPSTGYSWDVQADPGLKVIALPAEQTRPGVPGAPSIDHYKIVAIARGNHRAVFCYQRPWEHGKPVKTLVYRFRIR